MRIVLRALTMLAGVLLLLGVFALALLNQVLAVVPAKTEPPTAEDMAELRDSMRSQVSTSGAAEIEPTAFYPTPPEPL